MIPSRFDPHRHHRRSIRLKEYDYTQPGGYFITIVTYQRALIFGEIVDREMQLSDLGRIAEECWRGIPEHFPNVELGAYVIMPNHVHGIILIRADENGMATKLSPSVEARHASPLPPHGVKRRSIGAIVGSFKSAVTRRIGREFHTTGIWQRNYYEHVIRHDRDLQNKTDYVNANPILWAEDHENPTKIKG